MLGIVKAYATRVGNGPFPTELLDATGERLREVGAEFGATTGRPRRCGWLDIPALRLAVRLSGIQHLALTKLDVLAGLDVVKLCVGYRLRGELLDELPVDPEDIQAAEPVYEELPGWPAPAGEARPHAGAGRSAAGRPALRGPHQRAGGPAAVASSRSAPAGKKPSFEGSLFGGN